MNEKINKIIAFHPAFGKNLRAKFISNKGFNQIDFAMGISLVLFIVFITVSYLSSSIVTPISTSTPSELRTKAENLNKMIFKTQGIPSDWHWKNRSVRPSLGIPIYKREVYLEEWNGTDNINKNIKVHLELNENAYKTSIRVYEKNESLKTNITNTTDEDTDNFLEEADVVFQINVSSYNETSVNIYYTRDNTTSSNYYDLTPDNHTLTIKTYSEEEKQGLSNYKLSSLTRLNYSDVKDKYGTKRNFYLKVENDTSTIWEYGMEKNSTHYVVPERGDVITYSDRIQYQHKNGLIEVVKASLTIW